MENKRIEYIDIMKDFAIMLVVMGHVLLGCKSESMPGGMCAKIFMNSAHIGNLLQITVHALITQYR